MAEFAIYLDRAGDYRWRLTANNGKTTTDSGESYVITPVAYRPSSG